MKWKMVKRQKLRLEFEEKETKSGLGPRERPSRESRGTQISRILSNTFQLVKEFSKSDKFIVSPHRPYPIDLGLIDFFVFKIYKLRYNIRQTVDSDINHCLDVLAKSAYFDFL